MNRLKILITLLCLIQISCSSEKQGKHWVQLGNSATGEGISNTNGSSTYAVIALENNGNPIVVWNEDNGQGRDNSSVWTKSWNGNAWIEMGSKSATGKGISDGSGNAILPTLAVDQKNNAFVSWNEFESNKEHIYIKRWNGETWSEVGIGSASGKGISEPSDSKTRSSLAIDHTGNPVVVWIDKNSGNRRIRAKRWDGNKWVEIGGESAHGGDTSNSELDSSWPSIALDSADHPLVAWVGQHTDSSKLNMKKWNGDSWIEVGKASSTEEGISSNSRYVWNPSLVLDSSDNPIVAWNNYYSFFSLVSVRRWDGRAWIGLGKYSTSGLGMSDRGGDAFSPSLKIDPLGRPVMAWMEVGRVASWKRMIDQYQNDPKRNRIIDFIKKFYVTLALGKSFNYYVQVKHWDGSKWVSIGGRYAYRGEVSVEEKYIGPLSLTLDSQGNPFIAWSHFKSGKGRIYVLRYMP